MATPKIIAIVGATGTQGSSVARTFLTIPNWHVRCLTRDTSSEKALVLSKLGGELVQADLDDEDSLVRAFAGAHAIFVNTDFWIPYRAALSSGIDPFTSARQGYEAEITHGKNAANAAMKIPTLEQFIYSALAHIVNYIEQLPDLAAKTSFIYIGAYISNPFLYPKFQPESGAFVSAIPATKSLRMPIIDTANSTGPFVRALVEDEAPGMKLLAYDDYLSVDELMAVWSRALGKPVHVIEMSVQEMHEKTAIPVEVLCGPAFIEEFGYCAGLDNVVEPAQLKSQIQAKTFEEWLKEQDIKEILGLKNQNQWDGLVQ
ncbi:hypothetical protein N7541_001918 [Penicillium brevicompactum]|uniref:NmrA-like domain-containing protein n=1 Tax=Penicillium brevicompactum TaxID=5074 RepID=A0A9W9UYA3_PENBR|nr:hypothetical protein N7541_001918 [Penicillium brevicompactum]